MSQGEMLSQQNDVFALSEPAQAQTVLVAGLLSVIDDINLSSREGLGRGFRSAVKDSQWLLQRTLARFSAPA